MELTMNLICSYSAGSFAYGLNTPKSDVDVRGVYLVEDPTLILNPYRYIADTSSRHIGEISSGIDSSFHELRHFFHILQGANITAIEALFNENWRVITPLFAKIIRTRKFLIDVDKFYLANKGYMLSELSFATGKRTGKLGGKRQEAVSKYSFSPKNFVQLLRLGYAASVFFRTGRYPINLRNDTDCNIHALLMDIKCNPERFTKDSLVKLAADQVADLDEAYEKGKEDRKREYCLDQSIIDSFVTDAYYPILVENHKASNKWFKWF